MASRRSLFRREATILHNRSQLEEFEDKGEEYLEMFSGFGPGLAELLAEVELVRPHIVYDDYANVDLGGRSVELVPPGPGAHQRRPGRLASEERILFRRPRRGAVLPDFPGRGRGCREVARCARPDASAQAPTWEQVPLRAS